MGSFDRLLSRGVGRILIALFALFFKKYFCWLVGDVGYSWVTTLLQFSRLAGSGTSVFGRVTEQLSMD
jgi:uncharacterized integral membrane protein